MRDPRFDNQSGSLKAGTRCTVERKMLNEYGRQSCIDLANYDATVVEPGQRDCARNCQEKLLPGSLLLVGSRDSTLRLSDGARPQ
jgi:hypothetical protein